ncbi:transcriptional regulator, AraC family [Mucilaginibacter paludis DSM 18603]|uniref:Transcriptional regulator, AraC family n=2 Tax=Mucilaginibacter TaxID=423349 RepID=H1YA74_9SPHI|nr:transcriptional regulator, AraC family [Mucilaginibacter paludis DSM 18603]
MFNFYDYISDNAPVFKSLKCDDNLFTMFNCGVENKYQDIWSHHNYIVYVAKGRKVWHTSSGIYDLTEGSLVFVRKGACIIEQFFDAKFCLLLFFVSDDFICNVLKDKLNATTRKKDAVAKLEPVLNLHSDRYLEAFFANMMVYFDGKPNPEPLLLQLKFRELILILTSNPLNNQILLYADLVVSNPKGLNLQTAMEENFCFNLKLKDFAKLCLMSLSAFKREFEKIYGVTPGKWLLTKRLEHARNLIQNANKSVKEAAFESGFENPSHFSRAFLGQFGYPPSSIKDKNC